jgi:glycosyltransferase involved in cell wall biosynthesis
MKSNKTLTIAIPTYNRTENLEKILILLKKEKSKNFLILISDDYSSNDTEKMVKKYQQTMKNIIYHRNKTNLGYSGNVCKLYELASTPYIWFLCDDDLVTPNAVHTITLAIKKYDPIVAIFNCTWINPFGQKVIAGVKKDKLYTDYNQITDYISLQRLSYLSIIVVKKIASIDEIKKTNYKDNIFFQITLGLFLLSKQCRFVEVADIIVHRNVGFKYGEFVKFNLIDHLKSVFCIEHKFDNKKFITWSKKALPSFLLLYLSQKIGLFVYMNKPTSETKTKIYRYYGWFYGGFINLFPIIYFLTPAFLLRFIYKNKLIKIHGKMKGTILYNQNINRATHDTRKTKFTTYK